MLLVVIVVKNSITQAWLSLLPTDTLFFHHKDPFVKQKASSDGEGSLWDI